MTKDELKTLITKIVSILRQNQDIATPKFLDNVSDILKKIKEFPNSVKTIAVFLDKSESDILGLFESLEKMIDLERSINDGTSQNLIVMLENLKERNIVLSIISKFI